MRARIDRRRGFTLIELMIVVAIIGILSAIAIPTFQSYVYRSRTAEAVTFLGEIRQRQESYRAEFGQYCAVSGPAGTAPGGGTWAPATAPGPGEKVAWTPSGDWIDLGAIPDGPVMFQYQTVAGPPESAPTALGFTGRDFWFVSQARADLDGDSEVMIMESYSASNIIFRANASMAPLGAAYE